MGVFKHVSMHISHHTGQHREREPLSYAPEDAHMNKTGCFVALREAGATHYTMGKP